MFERVDKAKFPPYGCAVCRRSEGPFVEVRVPVLKVSTSYGLKEVPGVFYLCIGRDIERADGNDEHHNGCARGIARVAGCSDPAEVQALRQNIRDHAEREVELVHQVEALTEEQIKVVPLSDLEDALRPAE